MEHMWAPWRMAYVAAPKTPPDAGRTCFMCAGAAGRANPGAHLVVGRGPSALAMLNRFPYNCGHVMIVPARHVAGVGELTADEALDLWRLTTAAQDALRAAFKPDGFNLGINEGAAAGAGHAGHLHVHVVPRWAGDHNYMTVCADVRVVPEALDDTLRRLTPLMAERGFPADA